MSANSHWSLGLLDSIKDPNSIVIEDERIVGIKDKYPKARYHFLVLPKEDIDSIYKLTRDDIELLKHMEDEAKNLVKQYKNNEFQIGYHAVPNMKRLHLHVISTDFDSVCLKTKHHWNTFTTSYFLPSEVVIKQLQETGKVIKMDKAKVDELLKRPLKCHKCNFEPKFLPQLKQHILRHAPQS